MLKSTSNWILFSMKICSFVTEIWVEMGWNCSLQFIEFILRLFACLFNNLHLMVPIKVGMSDRYASFWNIRCTSLLTKALKSMLCNGPCMQFFYAFIANDFKTLSLQKPNGHGAKWQTTSSWLLLLLVLLLVLVRTWYRCGVELEIFKTNETVFGEFVIVSIIRLQFTIHKFSRNFSIFRSCTWIKTNSARESVPSVRKPVCLNKKLKRYDLKLHLNFSSATMRLYQLSVSTNVKVMWKCCEMVWLHGLCCCCINVVLVLYEHRKRSICVVFSLLNLYNKNTAHMHPFHNLYTTSLLHQKYYNLFR